MARTRDKISMTKQESVEEIITFVMVTDETHVLAKILSFDQSSNLV
jgi:hypothetical protein